MLEIKKCAVKGCQSEDTELFKSPKSRIQLQKWKEVLGIKKDEFYVCELHFDNRFINLQKVLYEEAVPSIQLESIQENCECCGEFLSDQIHQVEMVHQQIFKVLFPFADLSDGLICEYCNHQLFEINDFIARIENRYNNLEIVESQSSFIEIEDESMNVEELEQVEIEYPENNIKIENNSTDNTNEDIVAENVVIEELLCESTVADTTYELVKVKKEKPEKLNESPRGTLKNQKTHQCEICNFSCKERTEFTEHVIKKHAVSDKIDTDIPQESSNDEHEDDPADNKNMYFLKCDICEKVINSNDPKKLIGHKNKVHGNGKNFWCSGCSKVYTSKDERLDCLKSHRGALSDIFVNCPECDKKIRYLGLKPHRMKMHSTIRSEICNFCGLGYATRGSLYIHLRNVHSSELEGRKIYQCDYCGTKTTTKPSLSAHMIKHKTHAKIYQCTICLKILNFGLKTHMIRVHPDGLDNGVRVNPKTNRYHCPKCVQSFIGMKRYEMHVKEDICSNLGEYKINTNDRITVYTQGQFKCNICNAEKTTLRNLRRHMRYFHTKENKCPVCEKMLSSQKAIYKHVKNVHKTSMTDIKLGKFVI